MSSTLVQMKQTYNEYAEIEKQIVLISQLLSSLKYSEIDKVYEQIRGVRSRLSTLIEKINDYSKLIKQDDSREDDEFFLELLNKKQSINTLLVQLEEDFYQRCFILLEELEKTVKGYIKNFLAGFKDKCNDETELFKWETKYKEILRVFSKISFPFFLVSSIKVELEKSKEVMNKIKKEIKQFPDSYKFIREEKKREFEKIRRINEWKERFGKIIDAYHRIKIDELADFLDVDDPQKIKQWIIEDRALGLPIKLDRDSIIIIKSDETKSVMESDFLDMLDTSFKNWESSERRKEGKNSSCIP